jgi:hypothetical protein
MLTAAFMVVFGVVSSPQAAMAFAACPAPGPFMAHWQNPPVEINPTIGCKSQYRHGNYIVVATVQGREFNPAAQACDAFSWTVWGVRPNAGNGWTGTTSQQNNPQLNAGWYTTAAGASAPNTAWTNIVWSCMQVDENLENGPVAVSRMGV